MRQKKKKEGVEFGKMRVKDTFVWSTGPKHMGLQPGASVSTRLINQLIHYSINQHHTSATASECK